MTTAVAVTPRSLFDGFADDVQTYTGANNVLFEALCKHINAVYEVKFADLAASVVALAATDAEQERRLGALDRGAKNTRSDVNNLTRTCTFWSRAPSCAPLSWPPSRGCTRRSA